MSFWSFIGDVALFNIIFKLFSGKPKHTAAPVHTFHPGHTLLQHADYNRHSESDMDIDDLQDRIDELEDQLSDCDENSDRYDRLQDKIDMLQDRLDEMEDYQDSLDDWEYPHCRDGWYDNHILHDDWDDDF